MERPEVAGRAGLRRSCVSLHGAPGEYPDGYVEVAPRTWAWLQPNGSWGETNAGLVVGSDAALVVDTLWDAALAGRMLRGAASLAGGAEITTVVNTHRDGDHWWGNAALPDRIEVWTSAAALAEMEVEPPPPALARLAALSGAGRWLPGPVGRLSRYTGSMLDPFRFGALPARRPDRSFEGELTLDVGGRPVRLLHLGPAHTEGDVAVHLPDCGVVFAGDLLFAGVTPVVWSGPVTAWIEALDRLLALDADVYVPGHGPVGTRSDVEQLRDYWTWFLDACEPLLAADLPPGRIVARLLATPGFARWQGWPDAERLAINVVSHHRRHTGAGPLGHGPLDRMLLFSLVAETHRALSR